MLMSPGLREGATLPVMIPTLQPEGLTRLVPCYDPRPTEGSRVIPLGDLSCIARGGVVMCG